MSVTSANWSMDLSGTSVTSETNVVFYDKLDQYIENRAKEPVQNIDKITDEQLKILRELRVFNLDDLLYLKGEEDSLKVPGYDELYDKARSMCYEDQVWTKKVPLGDTSIVADHEMQKEEPDKYPEAWAAYKSKKQVVSTGTPIGQIPTISASQINDLNRLNIYTIEHLLAAPENAAHKIIGFHDLKRRAKDELRKAGENSLISKFKIENDEKDKKINEMSEMLATMQKQIKALESKPKKKKVTASNEDKDNDAT